MLRQAKDRLGDPLPPQRRLGHGISPFQFMMRSAVPSPKASYSKVPNVTF
jgi:hypothetical protein